MSDQINIGPIRVTIPQGCPDPAMFENTVRRIIGETFSETSGAAASLVAWQQAQIVPEPFAANEKAAQFYTQALIELDPMAQKWEAVETKINEAFASYSFDDGSSQVSAIPGWTPHGWIVISA